MKCIQNKSIKVELNNNINRSKILTLSNSNTKNNKIIPSS